MKKLALFLAILLVSIHSFGQFSPRHDRKNEAKAFVRHLLQRQQAQQVPAAKTTALKQRLIAYSAYNVASSKIMDSFSVNYSGTRGSKFDPEFMDYGEWVGPGYRGFFDILYGYNENGQPRNKNMAPYISGDSFTFYSQDLAPPYTFGHRADQYHSYDANNNLLDELWVADTSTGGGSLLQVMRYDALSNITRASYVLNTSGTFDTIETAFFLYNSSNRMVLDSVCAYDAPTNSYRPVTKVDYAYDGAGNMNLARYWEWNSIAWQPKYKYTMTYIPVTHQLKTFKMDTMVAGGTYKWDSFGYSPGISYSTYSKHITYNSSGAQAIVVKKRYNTAGLADSIDQYNYSFGDHELKVFTYNSYNNPVTLSVYDSAVGSSTNQLFAYHYYYELYDASAAAVANVSAQPASITIYPNPACNSISLSCAAFSPGMPVSFTITNMAGRKLLSETLRWQNTTEQISLSELLPGTYMISVSDGKCVYTRQVIKL